MRNQSGFLLRYVFLIVWFLAVWSGLVSPASASHEEETSCFVLVIVAYVGPELPHAGDTWAVGCGLAVV
jgi:hypothetical protein